jgi:hypothetical protein
VKEDLSKRNYGEGYPRRECRQFNGCSANKCPLDPWIADRVSAPDDEVCTASRTERETIAARHVGKLPTRGLLVAEFKAEKASEKMLVEIERLRSLSDAPRHQGKEEPNTLAQHVCGVDQASVALHHAGPPSGAGLPASGGLEAAQNSNEQERKAANGS